MNDRFTAWLRGLALALLAFGASAGASAQYACLDGAIAADRPFDNPCNDDIDNDVILPMPGGELFMVFRSVIVPGPDFWGNEDRRILIGNPDPGVMFETRREVVVAGSFPTSDGDNWRILLGKYEVTLAQFATVFGEGDIDAGLQRLKDLADGPVYFDPILEPSASDGLRKRFLRSPVRGMRVQDYENFISAYNEWCYSDGQCRAAMPKLEGVPGFFRLPTEIEWEYAARKGTGENPSGLPFDLKKEDQTDYAYLTETANSRIRNEPRSIGGKKPTRFGIHDLYGNVAELMDGRFYAELADGKPGMYTTRGGDYQFDASEETLRPHLREETPNYVMGDGGRPQAARNERVGIRLAIGSLVRLEGDAAARQDASFRVYTSSGISTGTSSTRSGTLQVAGQLRNIGSVADKLKDIDENASAEELSESIAEVIAELENETQQAQIQLRRTSERLASQQARNVIRDAGEMGRAYEDLSSLQTRLELASDPDAIDALKRQVPSLERQIDLIIDRVGYFESSYVAGIERLEGYGAFADDALERISAQGFTSQLDETSFGLVRKHVTQLRAGDSGPDDWTADIQTAFQ
jgi:hypothetical protein